MIWCVEDDASIRDIEIYALKSTGFEARGFEDSASFCEAIRHEKPELIVLDIMLPGTDGIQLLRQLKASPELCDIPVVMATAKGEEYDKIQGLDLGADYYLTKPFGVMEFVSCIKAVLRRCRPKTESQLLKAGDIVMNVDEHTVSAGGERITLTYKEFELLTYFVENKGIALSREKILNNVWNYDYFGDARTIDTHVKKLRNKMGEKGDLIKTIWGMGYKLEADET